MSNMTFDPNSKNIYETWEWENHWVDYANNDDRPRIYNIGDSISWGCRDYMKENFKEVYLDNYASSFALDNPIIKETIRLFGIVEGRRDLIIYNNGHHGGHIEDATEYARLYEDMVKYLLETYKGTPIALATTTYVTGTAWNGRVKVRNAKVKEIAEKYGLPVIDLYEVSEGKDDLFIHDGVHFNADGYKLLCEHILKRIKEILAPTV